MRDDRQWFYYLREARSSNSGTDIKRAQVAIGIDGSSSLSVTDYYAGGHVERSAYTL